METDHSDEENDTFDPIFDASIIGDSLNEHCIS
jgi:hypothetical protein